MAIIKIKPTTLEVMQQGTNLVLENIKEQIHHAKDAIIRERYKELHAEALTILGMVEVIKATKEIKIELTN